MKPNNKVLFGIALIIGAAVGAAACSVLGGQTAYGQHRVVGSRAKAVEAIKYFNKGLTHEFLVLFDDGTIRRASTGIAIGD